jgi:hypothetical protein
LTSSSSTATCRARSWRLRADGWIEALTTYPKEVKITWRVSDRGQLAKSFDRITQQLAHGYEGLAFDGVAIVEMTPPAGLRDLSS